MQENHATYIVSDIDVRGKFVAEKLHDINVFIAAGNVEWCVPFLRVDGDRKLLDYNCIRSRHLQLTSDQIR